MIKATAKDKVPNGVERSPHWPAARRVHLESNPTCAVCGGNRKLEVHHIQPFHIHPELELSEANFITLCENNSDGVNCHLLFGHLGNYRSFNVNVTLDAVQWAGKIGRRPKL